MLVLCVNDRNKPESIPNNLWIKKGRMYEIERVIIGTASGHRIAVLKHPKLGKEFFPIMGYEISRFAPIKRELVEKGKVALMDALKGVGVVMPPPEDNIVRTSFIDDSE